MLSFKLMASRQTVALILAFAGGASAGSVATAAFGQPADRRCAHASAQRGPEVSRRTDELGGPLANSPEATAPERVERQIDRASQAPPAPLTTLRPSTDGQRPPNITRHTRGIPAELVCTSRASTGQAPK